VFQTPEGLGMNNTVAVALKRHTDITDIIILLDSSSPRIHVEGGKRGENFLLPLLQLIANGCSNLGAIGHNISRYDEK
jgi:hypothetical protein